MKDVVKAILKSVGIKSEDMTIQRIHEDSGDGLYWVPTNGWSIVFDYKKSHIVVELNKLGSKDSWVSLFKYSGDDLVDSYKVKLINITAEELYNTIKDFIEE